MIFNFIIFLLKAETEVKKYMNNFPCTNTYINDFFNLAERAIVFGTYLLTPIHIFVYVRKIKTFDMHMTLIDL